MGGNIWENICGNISISDDSLLLLSNSTYPRFTECFQHTLLVWIPCGLMWMFLPYHIFRLMGKRDGKSLPHNYFHIIKSVLSSVLCLLMVAELIRLTVSPEDHFREQTLYFIGSTVKLLTFLVTIPLMQLLRIKGAMTSGLLFIFWLLILVTGIISCYSILLEENHRNSILEIALLFVYLAVVLIQFILHCFAEKHTTSGMSPGRKEPCPETYASFPSKLVFWWANSLIMKGFKKSLTEEDLWDLRPKEKAEHVYPQFEKCWNHEVTSCDRYNTLHQRNRLENHTKLQKDYPKNTQELVPLNYSTEENEIKGRGENTREKPKKPSLLKVIIKTFGKDTLKGICTLLLFDVLEFANPMLLGMLVSYIQNKDTEPVWRGYSLACLFYVNAIVLYAVAYYNDIGMKVLGLRLKNALVSAVYKKVLVMDNETKAKSTVGEVVNLISTDCDRMEEINFNIIFCVSMPFRICLCMFLLWNIFGSTVLAGISVIFVLIPVNGILLHYDLKLNRKLMDERDRRCKVIGEVLNGMKVLKLYAWEESFQRKISDIRNKELEVLRKLLLIDACYVFSCGLVPFLIGVISFSLYIFTQEDNYLDAEKAFVALSLFDHLQWPMLVLPYVTTYLVQARVSMDRISKFLRSGEIDPDSVRYRDLKGTAIKVDEGTFCWGRSKGKILKNITLEIPKGKLVAVVGQVGAGKSSLLSAFLGEMDKTRGEVILNGSVAYVPQVAWIQNESFRENILFGSDMNWDKYQNVLDSCCLRPDLNMFSAGDLTEIGEKGINLSGGQKQRLSLARAVYYNAEIYLMDDPLSAVDSHVGKHIFDDVIGRNGLLKNKTRVLVTHGVKWLPKVDSIIVLKEGKISEMGSYEELLNHDGDFAKFLRTYLLENKDDEDSDTEEVQKIRLSIIERLDSLTSNEDNEHTMHRNSRFSNGIDKDDQHGIKPRPNFDRSISYFDDKEKRPLISTDPLKRHIEEAKGQTIEDEEVQTGKVKGSVYMTYFRLFGYCGFVISIVVVILEQLAMAGGHILLSQWTEDPLLTNKTLINTTEYKTRSLMFVGIYAGFGIAKNILDVIQALIIYLGSLKVSRNLHASMLWSILRSPMSFFDTTPVGRILNRFSSDAEKIDKNLPLNFRMLFYRIIRAIITIVVICYNTPIFVSVIVPVVILYFLIQIERLETKTLSPVYSYLGETVNGASTIRAYRKEQQFIQESQSRLDANILSKYSLLVVTEWAGIRLEYVGNIFVFGAALFAVISSDISAGVAGLCVTYALQITASLNDLVKQASNLETSIVSLERVKEYSELKPEASWIIQSKRPCDNWPRTGNIRVDNYKTRYRDGLELVLKGISCDINGGEKVGIVGRTGAGKSSLMSSLFRLIESVDGSITIDGQQISEIGLHDLRSRLTILPQDPVLFSGSLRMNLDPFDNYEDSEVWTAINHAHLKSVVMDLKGGLLFECGEGGQNLSVGQRQLVCLARALLHKTKILILDEATAAVDMETDELIQETIRSEFSECTVLTIAHRLNTIMDYDKILVLDQGMLVEFDSPKELLENHDSVFYKMAKDSNLV